MTKADRIKKKEMIEGKIGEFPSLKGKIHNKLKKGTGGYAGRGIRADYVELVDVRECCIDKQEAIKKINEQIELAVKAEINEVVIVLEYLKEEFERRGL